MLASLCWLLAATQPISPAQETPKVSLSNEMGLASLDAIGAALTAPLENENEWEVTMEDGSKRQIKNCRDFLSVNKTKFDVQSEYDWSTLYSAGARCFALEALGSAKAPSQSFLSWFTFSAAAVANLPPRLDMLDAPASIEAAKKAENACKPWGKYDRTLKVRVETPARASLRTSGWSGRLVLYARGDFNGDGIEDLLLRRDAHVDDGGTAADSSVFIVTQTSAKRCPRVIRSMGAPH